MKIAMIGSGAAGSVFASYLRLGGADMYLVDLNKAHMDKVAAEGMIFRTPEGEFHPTGFHTAYSADGIGVMDIVIVMVKSTQTAAVMPGVMPAIGPDTVVVSLQNGLGNDDELKKFVPANRIVCGNGVMGTELPEPGVCVAKPEKGICMQFGMIEPSDVSYNACMFMKDTFTKGGCPAAYYEDIRPYIWKKAISNSGFNPVSTILRLKMGVVGTDDNGAWLVWHIWKEACEVAKAAGIRDLWPEMVEEMPKLVAHLGNYYPSMAQDALMFKRQTEISTLNAKIAEYGEKYGVPTPVNETISKIMLAIQAHYGEQYQEK